MALSKHLEHGSARRNWVLLAGTALLAIAGIAFVPAVRTRVAPIGLWQSPELALWIALAVMMLVSSAFLRLRQRGVTQLRERLAELEQERAKHAERHYGRLLGLLRVSRIMGSAASMEAVFDAITSACREMFDCQRVSLMLLDHDTRELVVQSVADDTDAKHLIGTRLRLGHGVAGWVAEQGEAMILDPNGVAQLPTASQPTNKSMVQSMIVPILVRDELVGVVNVGSRSADVRYDNEDLRALQVFAENAGACVRHAQQAHWMRQTIQRLQAETETTAL